MTTSFAELGLNEQILAGVEALGFETPTPVQAQAIPYVLAGRDVVASAQTGTGKTAAFTLPTLQLIASLRRDVASDGESTTASRDAMATRPDVEASANAEPPDATDQTKPTTDDTQPTRRRRRRRRRRSAEKAPVATSEALAAETPDDPLAHELHQAEVLPARASDETLAREGLDAGKTIEVRQEGSLADSAANEGQPASADPTPRKRRRRRRRKKGAAGDAGSAPSQQPAPTGPAAPLALVVTPTRELAQQIEQVAQVVCAQTGQRAVIVMGGARFDRQLRQLAQGCDLLVATPGRLIDLMEHGHVDLSQVRVLVLDEADRMLDMGFWPSVRRILQALPTERQNLLFSATIPPSIQGTLDAMLHDPATIEIARIGETADTVEEHLCPITQGQKTQLLRALIEHDQPERVLVFCRTKHRVDDVSKTLKAAGLRVEVMHADRPQRARDKALERFRAATVQLLVATDVMSRGIDVSGIDTVVNYDVPMDPEDYVHRIGRTGRAGHTGHAYTFVAPDEISPLREIEYFTHKLVPVWDLEGFPYDDARIVPNSGRATSKPTRTMFSGSRSRTRGPLGGRFGRHY